MEQQVRAISALLSKFSYGQPLQKFWKDSDSLIDQHVLEYIKQLNKQRGDRPPSDSVDHGTWTSPPNPLCAASFGDSGMTATVNAYGLLMQFGDYLGMGRSGFFTADHDFVSEPYFVASRASDLDDMTKASSLRHESYGVSLEGLTLEPEQQPKLSWKQWRWPCYEYGPEQFCNSKSSLTIDWMVHGKTLLHRCVLENSDDDRKEISIKFLKKLRIRELDHMESEFRKRFNRKGNTRLEGGPGPGRCTWIWRAPYAPSETEQKVTDKKDLEQETPTNAGIAVSEEIPVGDVGSSDSTKIRLGYFQSEGAQRPKILITQPTQTRTENVLASERGANTEESRDEPRVVIVVAAVFVNGVPKQFDSEQDWSSPQVWKEELPKGARDTTDTTRTLEIITAYRMLVRPLSDVSWQDLVITADEVDMDFFVKNNSLRPEYLSSISSHNPVPQTSPNDTEYETEKIQSEVKDTSGSSTAQAPDATMSPCKIIQLVGIPQTSSSPSDHIEYMIWRNLEHILSVCSVPVGPRRDDGIQPVALTCGDMSMHRICTSASFFAIQFLIEVSKRLAHSNGKPDAIRSHQERIKKVCLGHIHWLISTDRLASGEFAANYWVTGKIYPDSSDSLSWQAAEAVVNTPFQILKAAEVLNFYDMDQTAKDLCEALLKQICAPWLKMLRKMDQRITFAWPHAVEEGTNTYRLDDHLWIWRALKALHDLKFLEGWNYSSDKRKVSIASIQREILQRFTIKNDDSGKRMFAVTRSAREHRFLFHARDTSFFYGLEFFLQSTSFRELWENTIQAQSQHEDNEEMTWDNAIRYALALIMGTHNYRINPTKSATEHVQSAIQSLLGISSPNGFFPGQLGESADDRPVPALFDTEQYRDFYFHAHFEISYILLLEFDSICQRFVEKRSWPKRHRAQPSSQSQNVETQLEKISNDLRVLVERISMQQDQSTSNEKLERRTGTAMKKKFPFGNSVDTTKIVEIDDEWLFIYPTFLEPQQLPLPNFTEISTLIDKSKGKVSGDLVSQQLELYTDGNRPFGDATPSSWIVAVTDVPKQRYAGKTSAKPQNAILRKCYKKEDLWVKLKELRTAENAKKRLVWLHEPDAETAVICYLTTPAAYQPSMSLFFDRHSKQITHFSEETSKLSNEWKTELLFSFYALTSSRSTKHREAGNSSSSSKNFPIMQESTLVHLCLGFRFEGDIFDRYWTCHFIETTDDQLDLERNSTQQPPDIHSGPDLDGDRDLRQRKALELAFVERMVDATLQGTETIIDQLKKELDKGIESYAQSSSEKYLADTHIRLQGLQNLLESIDTSISSILDVMNMWDAREKDRAQQPRWTRNDERKYRESINNLRGSVERKLTDLKGVQHDARALKEKFVFTITTNIAKISENRSTSKEENLRLFTYVTVVFLPLGFAASIFSMSGTPEPPILVDMITCAIVALILTVIMLLNAKRLADMAQEISHSIHKYSLTKMKQSQIAKYHATDHIQSETAKHRRVLKTEDDEKSWYILFWVAYVLIEFPARRVFVACRVLMSLHRGKQDFEVKTPQTDQPTSEQGDGEVAKSPDTTSASTQTSMLGSAIRVLGGIIFSPVFVTSWVIQLIIYNMWDLLRLLHRVLLVLLPLSGTTTNDLKETHPDIWFKPGKWWRPIRELTHSLRDTKVSKVEEVKSENEQDSAEGQIREKTEVIEKSKSG